MGTPTPGVPSRATLRNLKKMSGIPILCYWDIRGLAQPARLLLSYTGTDFEDRQLSCGPAPDFDRSCWIDTKFSLGLDFPNLPYYIDGDVKITQSNAILRYIGRKHNLLGTNESERICVDMMENEIGDFRSTFVSLCYNPNFESRHEAYRKALPERLAKFSKFLGENDWLAGENISIVDFILYEMLDQHVLFEPKCLDGFPNLKAYVDRFRSLEKIKAYMQSSQFISNRLNNRMAKFGSGKN